MADPIKTVLSLDQLAQSYSVFEKDQVLTAEQLNSVARYFDDQTRLSRVELIGVGVVSGLQCSATAMTVSIGKGVGVTSDGDLVLLPLNTEYDGFIPYTESAPRYVPFFTGPAEFPELLPAVELVPTGSSVENKRPLSELPTPLGDSVVVMYVESFEQDHDLCNEADCDNVGITCSNTQRVLLMPTASIGALDFVPSTLRERAKSLPVLLANRPLVSGNVVTVAALTAPFVSACGLIHQAIVDALPMLAVQLADFVQEIFDADPSGAWRALLDARRAAFNASPFGIQYYYDHLKDLVETWNALRDTLTQCDVLGCPDPKAFPKHLLLGTLVRPRAFRFGFWPSALTSDGDTAFDHAGFLARKLGVLIESFELPASGGSEAIRATPSRTEAAPLEERAIPYYYRAAAVGLLGSWSWRSSRNGTSRYLQAYRAAELGGLMTEPLSTQCAQFDFFRVEGHLGQPVETVIAALQSLGARFNLPFAVRAVLLHDRTGPIKRPPGATYGDLHRFHKLVRAEVDSQLARATVFSEAFRERVKSAVDSKDIQDPTRMAQADAQNSSFTTTASAARQALAKPRYSAFKSDSSWTAQYASAFGTAGAFKKSFGDVARTDFSTPFDSVVSSNFGQWLNWLDVLIDDKRNKGDEKLLLSKYLAAHPGIEHAGGVSRGGTLVLAYDESGRVLGDFALPYREVDQEEEERDEPKLDVAIPPNVRDGMVLVKPIEFRVEDARYAIVNDLKKEIDIQKQYTTFFKESLGSLGDILNKAKGTRELLEVSPLTDDALLDGLLNEVRGKRQQLEGLRSKLARGDLPAAAVTKLNLQIERNERDLGVAVNETTKYLVDAEANAATSEATATAIAVVGGAVGAIRDREALSQLEKGFQTLLAEAPAARKGIVSGISNVAGIRLNH